MTAFDVAVVGGGPAAASVALRLAAMGRSVVMFVRSGNAGAAVGEVLGPEVVPLLVQLGVAESFLASGARPAHGVWSAWGGAPVVAKDFVMNPLGPAFRVDRPAFDRLLLSATERASVRVERGARRIDARREGDCWRITAAGLGGARAVEARFVVDATGRAGAIARSQGAVRVVSHRLVALIGRMEPDAVNEAVNEDVLFLESTSLGWWYSTVTPGGDLVATFLTDADLVRRPARTPEEAWSEALASAPLTASRTEGFQLARFSLRLATIGRLDSAAGPGWVAAGDAASTIDPLSGVGVARALRSGILAADALSVALSGNGDGALADYAERTRADHDAALGAGSRYYGVERRWSDAPFWRRRHPVAARIVEPGSER